MAGAEITIDASGAFAALEGYIARLDHPKPMFDAIGASLVTSTQHRFDEQHGPDGTPWPPSMRALAEGGKTLEETLRLYQSITVEADDAGVAVGTNVVYAAIHQFGGTIAKPERTQTIYRRYDARADELSPQFVKKSKSNFVQDVSVSAHEITMPARPFLGMDTDDEAEVVQIAEDYIFGSGAIVR